MSKVESEGKEKKKKFKQGAAAVENGTIDWPLCFIYCRISLEDKGEKMEKGRKRKEVFGKEQNGDRVDLMMECRWRLSARSAAEREKGSRVHLVLMDRGLHPKVLLHILVVRATEHLSTGTGGSVIITPMRVQREPTSFHAAIPINGTAGGGRTRSLASHILPLLRDR